MLIMKFISPPLHKKKIILSPCAMPTKKKTKSPSPRRPQLMVPMVFDLHNVARVALRPAPVRRSAAHLWRPHRPNITMCCAYRRLASIRTRPFSPLTRKRHAFSSSTIMRANCSATRPKSCAICSSRRC